LPLLLVLVAASAGAMIAGLSRPASAAMNLRRFALQPAVLYVERLTKQARSISPVCPPHGSHSRGGDRLCCGRQSVRA
jgi:hypothetical protein